MPPCTLALGQQRVEDRARRRRRRCARRSVTLPVSVSTSTTATCVPNGKVGPPRPGRPRRTSGLPLSLERRLRQLARTARDGRVPGHVEALAGLVETMSLARRPPAASAAQVPGLLDESTAAWLTAAPPAAGEREPQVPAAARARGRCRRGSPRCPRSGCPAGRLTSMDHAVSWPWPCGDVPGADDGLAVGLHLDGGELAVGHPAVW